jgi:hypothetical protein
MIDNHLDSFSYGYYKNHRFLHIRQGFVSSAPFQHIFICAWHTLCSFKYNCFQAVSRLREIREGADGQTP